MDEKLDLIKSMRLEIDELKHKLEVANSNYTNSITEKEKTEEDIKILEDMIDKIDTQQYKILLKFGAIPILIAVIAGIFNLQNVLKILAITIVGSLFPMIFPRFQRLVYNFLMKLSPKLKLSDTKINAFKKELKRKVECKKKIEVESKYLLMDVDNAKRLLEDKENELKMVEDVYFNDLFGNYTNEVSVNMPKTNIVKVRRKVK